MDIITQARRYATWIERARFLHRLIRELVLHVRADEEANETSNGDGTVTIRVPAAAWQETKHEADEPLPPNSGQN
jgi:hypothetical protein